MNSEEKEQHAKEQLASRYKQKGAQQLSLEEYLALQKKKTKSVKKLPAQLQFLLATPFLIIFCFGIFFLPYLAYVIFTSPSNDSHTLQTQHAQQTASASAKNMN